MVGEKPVQVRPEQRGGKGRWHGNAKVASELLLGSDNRSGAIDLAGIFTCLARPRRGRNRKTA
jgi:hypothetical protein